MEAPNSIEQPSAAGATAPETGLQKGKRLTGLLSWYVVEVVLEMGIMPLVLIPICAQIANENAVGLFIYVLGIVSLVGLTPTKGLNNALLRDLSATSSSKRPIVIRTSMTMAMVVIGLLAIAAIVVCSGVARTTTASTDTVWWIAILAIAFAARNLQTTGTVDLTVSRRFGRRMVWRSLGPVLALAAIPAYIVMGDRGLPLGFAFGHLAALCLLLFFRRRAFLGRPQIERGMIGPLGRSWLVLSSVTFFATSGRYIHRTVLGSCHDIDTVTTFFAGSAILDLCMMPLATLGLFGFQLLSAHRSREKFSRAFFLGFAAASLLGVPLFYFLARWIAVWPLRWFYAYQADEAMAPMSIMTIGMAVTVLMHASRPFVQKFSSLRLLGVLGVVSLVAHLGAALLLIPAHGIHGAAWSYTIGHGVTGIAWFACFFTGFLKPAGKTKT